MYLSSHLPHITLAAAALAFAAPFAGAAPKQGPPPEFFNKLDANHDGRISLEEFYPTGPAPLHPRMRKVFESHDPKHTGSISFEDTAKTIATVSGVMPQLTPTVTGGFAPLTLEVHPQTKRAFIKVTIHGVTGNFLLDTGTSDTILHPDFAKRAGVDFVEVCQTITAGNMGKRGDFVSLVRVDDLVLGETHFRDFHAVLQPSKRATYEFGKPIDGLIGASIIFAKPVTLDYRHGRVTYQTMPAAQADWTLPLTPSGHATANVDADIDGVKVNLMFDSGAAINDAILINEPYHAAFRQLTGKPDTKSYTAKSVRVAGQEIDANVLCLLNAFERSVVSSVFFDQHLISFDIAARKMLIQRNPAPATKPATPPN